MKYIILVPDGVADYPLAELGNRTPLEAAHTTNMDFMAQHGFTGLVQTIPRGMQPGSDVGNLSILGYDPRKYFPGRASLEAANLDITLAHDEIAFRCNLVTVADNTMVDYSAGHISSEEAANLIDALNNVVALDGMKFYAGKSYRHLLVMKAAHIDEYLHIKCTPPHDILGKKIEKYLPSGKQSKPLLRLMERSRRVLEEHQVNNVRIDLGENPANMIWLWGQGERAELPTFKERFNVKGSIISAVDLVNGIGKLAGLEVITVPGVTGYYDTNYAGKAQYALDSLKRRDFVFVHVEATDEAAHNGDVRMKIACIERFDKEVVGTVLNYFNHHDNVRILVVPDHATPIEKRTHTSDPVCFVMHGKGILNDSSNGYNESCAKEKGLKFKSGEALIEYFMTQHV